MNTNLTDTQLDYAVFLPAISGFYSTFIGKQRFSEYVAKNRIPASFTNGVESLNLLNPNEGQFYYKWCLYSAGHADLDLTKQVETEDMFRNRDRSTSFVMGDSGGYQIAKGCWPADWKDPNCPIALKKRQQVLTWMDSLMDYGMCLDVPAWVYRSKKGSAATKITTYQEAVTATKINNDYFVKNRSGACKFLNVLQGNKHSDAQDWYDTMKGYCDPKLYPGRHFDGWAMGGQHTGDVELILRRIVQMRFDGLLEPGLHDRMHFLGISRLEWALLLTDIQRAVRKYHNPNFTITFDCASPFLATANGQVYVENKFESRGKWSYRMVPAVDKKKYHKDFRLYKDAVIADKRYKRFESSPIIDQCTMRDICIYGPGDLNKNKKEGKTSWDSFSYAILMGHNLYRHIDAVQEANRLYASGTIPKALAYGLESDIRFSDIVEAVFATSDFDMANEVITQFRNYFDTILGTRGMTGKALWTSDANFNRFFTVVEDDDEESIPLEHGDDFTEDEQNNLDNLEESLK